MGIRTNLPLGRLRPRLGDEGWWRKALRAHIRHTREETWREIAPEKMRWCSPDGFDERLSIIADEKKWAANVEMEDANGRRVALASPQQRAQRQRAELLARSAGVAKAAGLAAGGDGVAYLATLTTPSRMHPTKMMARAGSRVKNKKYDGSSIKESHLWLAKHWKAFLSDARSKTRIKHGATIARDWTSTVQPHEDGTPHRHVVFYARSEDEAAAIHACLLKHFRDVEREPGDQHRVDWKRLGDADAGVKYIARAIGYITRATGEDAESATAGDDDAKEQISTLQWANGVRRFTTSRDSVGAYRLARRQDVAGPEDIKEAARSGDYHRFIALHRQAGGKLAYTTKQNRYGEDVKRVAGVQWDGVVFTPQSTWRAVPKRPESPHPCGCAGGMQDQTPAIIPIYRGKEKEEGMVAPSGLWRRPYPGFQPHDFLEKFFEPACTTTAQGETSRHWLAAALRLANTTEPAANEPDVFPLPPRPAQAA